MIIEKPTGALRFVYKLVDGAYLQKVLQQQWKCSDYDECKIETEWRDVPLVEEGDE